MGENPFQLIVAGKLPAKAVYEDDLLMAVLSVKPLTKGHLILFTKEPYAYLSDVPSPLCEHLFIRAREISRALLKNLDAKGTNILITNGPIDGNAVSQFVMHIIPRYGDDQVKSFEFKSMQPSEQHLLKLKEAFQKRMESHEKINPVKESIKLLPRDEPWDPTTYADPPDYGS